MHGEWVFYSFIFSCSIAWWDLSDRRGLLSNFRLFVCVCVWWVLTQKALINCLAYFVLQLMHLEIYHPDGTHSSTAHSTFSPFSIHLSRTTQCITKHLRWTIENAYCTSIHDSKTNFTVSCELSIEMEQITATRNEGKNSIKSSAHSNPAIEWFCTKRKSWIS